MKGHDPLICLPKGISGFGNPEPNELVSKIEFKQFCYDLLIELQYKKFEILNENSGNYYIGLLRNRSNQIYALMNNHYPFVGIADRYEYGNAFYIDHIELNTYINLKTRLINQESKYQHYYCLSKVDLEREVTNENIKLLEKEEINQMNYWKPTRIKDIVFNNWD